MAVVVDVIKRGEGKRVVVSWKSALKRRRRKRKIGIRLPAS